MMTIKRREFMGTALALGASAATSSAGWQGVAQAPPRTGGNGQKPVTAWTAKVEQLFKVPGLVHPNAMEATSDGLWIGDQVSEKVYKVDWQTGKVLQELQTESHNMSGLAIGDGYIWAGSNGGVSGRRPPRPQDKPFGELAQLDMKTGKIVKVYRLPWGGGIHGVSFAQQTGRLWVTAMNLQAIAEVDHKDNMRVLRMFAARGQRAHGIDWDNGAMWVLFATEREVRKFDPDTGRVLEAAKLSPTADPDAHGMCVHNGYMYYCDAGLTAPGPGSEPGQICRFKLQSGSATA